MRKPFTSEVERAFACAIHEASREDIVAVDVNHIIVFHNRRPLEVLGLARDAIQGSDGGVLTGLPARALQCRTLDLIKDPQAFLKRIQELNALKRADGALYEAKRTGRDRTVRETAPH